MTTYGTTSTGFVRKPISTILAEIEAANITEFGPGVIQTPETPQGQLNGIFAELVAKVWEIAEDVYQSYDPDQAEGIRLEQLGRIRLLDRGDSESDQSFRQGITNDGAARVDLQDLSRAVSAVSGVTYSHVWINDTADTDDNGMPGGSICFAVTGGDAETIATAVRTYIAPGVIVHGNTSVDTVIDGYCRTIRILRPIDVAIDLTVTIRKGQDKMGCPPPSGTAVRAGLIENLYLLNGDDITNYRIRSVIESLYTNVEVVSINSSRDEIEQEDDMPVEIGFVERAYLDNVTILEVD